MTTSLEGKVDIAHRTPVHNFGGHVVPPTTIRNNTSPHSATPHLPDELLLQVLEHLIPQPGPSHWLVAGDPTTAATLACLCRVSRTLRAFAERRLDCVIRIPSPGLLATLCSRPELCEHVRRIEFFECSLPAAPAARLYRDHVKVIITDKCQDRGLDCLIQEMLDAEKVHLSLPYDNLLKYMEETLLLTLILLLTPLVSLHANVDIELGDYYGRLDIGNPNVSSLLRVPRLDIGRDHYVEDDELTRVEPASQHKEGDNDALFYVWSSDDLRPGSRAALTHLELSNSGYGNAQRSHGNRLRRFELGLDSQGSSQDDDYDDGIIDTLRRGRLGEQLEQLRLALLDAYLDRPGPARICAAPCPAGYAGSGPLLRSAGTATFTPTCSRGC
ncbi:hypothetical protein Micbo1qcDRAFT_176221 [Microdochium bolleyi]|uniref:F-box domain-containing protein n=1 Tax=Microdochium bolleyi TaxID=196109 RepID=A0A136IZL3_9PEZI|nr:hypothetical protein Micbo1qcDRAFT_176221 [Microdochium bolleyi]